MNGQEERGKREEFCDILRELAKEGFLINDKMIRENIYQRFEKLYSSAEPEKQFRHFYSDIFSVLREVKQTPEMGDINILGQNIALLWEFYDPSPSGKKKQKPDIGDALRKLYDHISLDIARMTYSDAGDVRLSQMDEIKSLHKKVKDLQADMESAKELSSQLKNTLKNTQKEYVAILGIFASIVLAFTGGFSFSSAVLSNIAQSSIYRICAVSLILGLVLLNAIFGLFYFLNHLISETPLNSRLLLCSNLMLLLLLLGVLLAWVCGLVETRNRGVEASSTAYSVSEVFGVEGN